MLIYVLKTVRLVNKSWDGCLFMNSFFNGMLLSSFIRIEVIWFCFLRCSCSETVSSSSLSLMIEVQGSRGLFQLWGKCAEWGQIGIGQLCELYAKKYLATGFTTSASERLVSCIFGRSFEKALKWFLWILRLPKSSFDLQGPDTSQRC